MKRGCLLVLIVISLNLSKSQETHIFYPSEWTQEHISNQRSLEAPEKDDLFLAKYNTEHAYQIPDNSTLRTYINKYLSYDWLPRVMAVFRFYEPLFEAKLQQYGLPLELKYLAIVESAMNPRAGSRVGAKGLWQFMPETASEMGLSWSAAVDLRYDPVASTDAACRYLKKLYNQLGDWNLVLSAYNAGIGRIQGIKRKVGSNDYWEIRPQMPKETRAYAPSFMAVVYLGEMATEHNLNSYSFPMQYDQVEMIQAQEDFILSDLYTGKNSNYIDYLNPHILNNVVPKGTFLYKY